jgi:hypothetical protein
MMVESGFTMKNKVVIDAVIEALLTVPENERLDVIRDVVHNPYFCFQCGYGDRERPNVNCQCWNDE